VLRGIGPALPKAMRANPAEHIARALLEAVVAGRPGVAVAESQAFA
jgi:hypothetical protein